jgi:hypothetical protein
MTQPLLHRESTSRTLAAVRRETETTRQERQATQAKDARHEAGWLTRFVRNLAPQDWYIALYFAIMLTAVACGTGPGRQHCIELVTVDILCLAAGLALTRGNIIPPGTFANAMLYRLTVWLTVFFSYFQLLHILPAVSERAIDGDIYAFDLRVFHVEPSLAWDRFVTPVTTEWFAFFYFGYFFLLLAHVLGIMLASKSVFRLSHFAMGIFLVFCTGHLVYMLVPGYGPYRYLASEFHHELTGGPFWQAVQATVHAGGAQKDIFPSLHTAAPTYFALFSYRHRKVAPYKYTWMIVGFCALQIICATMFLRWHYLIDIFAGITLATFACVAGERLVTWDAERRAELSRELGPDTTQPVQPNFVLLDYSWLKRLLRLERTIGRERAS